MLKLINYPNDFLKKQLKEFDWNNPIMDPMQLEKEMIDLMIQENGIGLSASQVGLDAKVFVMKPKNVQGFKNPFAAFNPDIIAVSEDEISDKEGCLSYPDLYFHVKRPAKILVEFFDILKNKCTITLTDIDARCFQHELDHLNGICFTDKISKFKLNRAIQQQRKKNGRTQQRTSISI